MSAKKSFLLRINPKLFEIYESWAADELRSVNSHLEFILRDAAVRAGRWPKGQLNDGGGDAENEKEETPHG
ncbi:MAG TPA: hypothetical protein PKW50_02845 [Syntrophomonas sp.]|nr:hypothetical protein [Syntrophomonas sp.]